MYHSRKYNGRYPQRQQKSEPVRVDWTPAIITVIIIIMILMVFAFSPTFGHEPLQVTIERVLRAACVNFCQ